MAKTEKLGLNLTEDESTTFADWRKSIDGNNPDGEKSNTQLIDDAMPLVLCMVPEFNKSYAQIQADYNNEEFDYSSDPVYSIWYDQFSRRPTVGELFTATGKSNDGCAFGFKGRVIKATNTIWFAFDDLVLYHNAEEIPLTFELGTFIFKSYQDLINLYNDDGRLALQSGLFNRTPVVGDNFITTFIVSAKNESAFIVGEVTSVGDTGAEVKIRALSRLETEPIKLHRVAFTFGDGINYCGEWYSHSSTKFTTNEELFNFMADEKLSTIHINTYGSFGVLNFVSGSGHRIYYGGVASAYGTIVGKTKFTDSAEDITLVSHEIFEV